MATIEKAELYWVDLEPEVKRTDAIQSFVCQETPMVKITDSDGVTGVGYTYTIGTGGSSVVALLHDHLLPQLIGKDPDCIEQIWRDLYFHSHATSVGAITSLALAAIDTALWDRKSIKAQLPLWKVAGGAKPEIPLYTTEGGWLHLTPEQLAEDAIEVQKQGFGGSKVKVGSPSLAEDIRRLEHVRKQAGDDYHIMVDANQSFSRDEAIKRGRAFADLGISWLEEPMPAEDISGHAQLCATAGLPIAVGESMYGTRGFREYLEQGACHIVQVDVARIGGITPWLKVAHLAETYNVSVCPHFLMELHVSLCCAVPNSRWLEFIPQLGSISSSRLNIIDGKAQAPTDIGLGIAWDWDKIQSETRTNKVIT
ncbi:putative L-alanine-DL-glutamate epimerase and related enzyme of enolase superfamily [Vibrio nigripulchritudo MADA3029]|uniref:mandelate racemase/muconate lactonizing enzyme family protein n=1 Tax=Vibrio nigripulchritudo TaxID=28173 RepID=UPI0003B19EE7|nr:mandelate racemase/muconate lactonizing enzyme family protein [Vibrio nigripulchritudo]CCN49256.1 putative L-alanine-DL-glutamate epimerase and related enzyme of enolase superfamily [Vibrio nigripulchritudo MADA3020]CCN54240.1 putative L-alanine-DL-glutamate epimerase and related enzyme of enolase superfamily [Vibrio nigripulchritudo MADA3021]CCN61311.1 putative L-alanine-DL-glutamate epimerase and related enzyme of enolase superfamily [Vibrio nigripulchritudo MADA3029]